MSDSNQETNYEADNCQQEQSPASFAFDKHGSDDDEEHQKLLSSNEQNGTDEAIEAIPVVESLNDNQVNQPKTLSLDKSLRKKDSTGVRWVDWEEVAEISEKKVLDSPTDTSNYSDDRDGLNCDYSNSSNDIKVPKTLPLSVEQVKLDSLTEASTIAQLEDEELESDSDLVSPEGKDTIEAHVDIIKERYEQIHKMKIEQRIRNNIEADNPFQPEGEVSKDANEIVDAIQSGNLQNIYTSPSGTLRRNNDPGLNPDSPEQELEKLVGGSVSECDIISNDGHTEEQIGKIVAKESIEPGKHDLSSNATVEVHKSIIPPPSQTQDVSVVVIPEKKSGCCQIL